MYAYVFFFHFFSHIGQYRVLSSLCSAVGPVGYLFHIQQCVHVNLILVPPCKSWMVSLPKTLDKSSEANKLQTWPGNPSSAPGSGLLPHLLQPPQTARPSHQAPSPCQSWEAGTGKDTFVCLTEIVLNRKSNILLYANAIKFWVQEFITQNAFSLPCFVMTFQIAHTFSVPF